MLNPLTGTAQDGIVFKVNGDNADVRPKAGVNGAGPQFIMPATDGTVKLPSCLKVRTMYEPGKGDDLASQLSHIVGLPVAPFDKEDGKQVITITALKGYGYSGLGKESPEATNFLDQPALDSSGSPVFGVMLDELWTEFVSMFFDEEGYKEGKGPRQRDLAEYIDRVKARMSQAKNMARQISIPKTVVETTFVVGPTPVVLPARYDNGGSTPIIFRLESKDAVLTAPEYFGNTQPRLAFIAFQEICKYFGLGRMTPLILLALFEAYGSSSQPELVTSFLETILVKINTTGKYAPDVYESTRSERAQDLTVMSIVYELFEHIIMFAAFDKLAESWSRAELFKDVHIEWYNEYADTYGEDIVNAAYEDMKWTGVPNDDEGTFKIKAMPYGFESESVPNSSTVLMTNEGTYGLVPLKLANAKSQWSMYQMASRVKTYGWTKNGNETISWPAIPATFDPQIGLVCDADNKAFLEIAVHGDAFAGWQRENVYESPRLFRLGITRTWKAKYSLGLGPMTLVDVLVDRHTQFGGNIVPFRLPETQQKAAKPSTYQLAPSTLFAQVKKKNAKQADGEEVN